MASSSSPGGGGAAPERTVRLGDYQEFDRVSIVTVPRFKSSPVSGSEWRTCARIDLFYKDALEYSESFASVADALAHLPVTLYNARNARMRPGANFHAKHPEQRCDQEGCAEVATVKYRVLVERCRECTKPKDMMFDTRTPVRHFCARHSERGEGYYDDSSANYELLAGAVVPPPAADVAATAAVFLYADGVAAPDADDDDDSDDE